MFYTTKSSSPPWQHSRESWPAVQHECRNSGQKPLGRRHFRIIPPRSSTKHQPGSTLYSNVMSRSCVPSSALETWATTCKFLTWESSWSRAVSSWKWVAKRQKAWICDAMCLDLRSLSRGLMWVKFQSSLWYCPRKAESIISRRA